MALDPNMLDGECECNEGAPAWMATFSDLATLLLTFFVLLLSFAEMDVVEFREMLGSVREAFGVQFERQGHIEAMSTSVVELNDSEAVPFTPLNQRQVGSLRAIERFIRERHMEGDVEVGLSDQGVVVRLKDRLAFAVGDNKLREEAEPVLMQIVELMKAFPASMSVEGHTDDVPIRNGKFRSNWELSSMRAIAVLEYLQSLGPIQVKNVSVVGHADNQPLVPNDTAEHRAQNRRVEFVFVDPDWSKSPEAFKRMQRALKEDGKKSASEVTMPAVHSQAPGTAGNKGSPNAPAEQRPSGTGNP